MVALPVRHQPHPELEALGLSDFDMEYLEYLQYKRDLRENRKKTNDDETK